MHSFEISNNNTSPILTVTWKQSVIESQRLNLIVCIIASFIHALFWLQLVFYPLVRQKALQWIYAYLIVDILLLLRFFLLYIVRTTYHSYTPNVLWTLVVCYIEAAVDNYLNILGVYILLALNISRYMQIAHNRNVYDKHPQWLILFHLSICLAPFLFLFIQFLVGWSKLKQSDDDLCDSYSVNLYIKVLNIFVAFAFPIASNIFVITLSVRHVRVMSTLRGSVHHVSAREKYNRSLVIQFLVFYIVWLSLWSPNVISYQFITGTNEITLITRLLNFIEIALDPIIVGALDVRFWQIWKELCSNFKCLHLRKRVQRSIKVVPAHKP
ncbi:unnamed protein product [Adineta ricciae]|uniref:G-protein coupled receptors family 1 profile domain-containing protein n=1 Tax=Adineta ricciae TaxID=249248 RepID=A0A816BQC2_ADIRI|nr:unnamed protein product [Adineta ricciae]